MARILIIEDERDLAELVAFITYVTLSPFLGM